MQKDITEEEPLLLDPEDSEVIQEPFDPTEIRVKRGSMTLDLLISRIKHKELNLSPDFQREMGIWNDGAQSRLIESLLIQIPIPAFYFDATDDSKWLVIDGVQRLTALARFVIDEQTLRERYPEIKPLKLCDLEFLTGFNGKTFEELGRDLQRRIAETQVTVYTIEPGTPTEVKYNIFQRINTGGLPLSDQEIRHALKYGKATDILSRLAKSDEFSKVTKLSIQDKRRGNQECILRFIAFTLSSYMVYRGLEDFDKLLNDTMDSMNRMSTHRLTELEDKFKKVMVDSHQILGKYAFSTDYMRTYNRQTIEEWLKTHNYQINKQLFEAWSVNLGQLPEDDIPKLIQKKEYLTNAIRDLLRDSEFSDAILDKARSVSEVQIRFGKIQELIKETLEEQKWTNIKEEYPVGSIVNGKVIAIFNHGALIEIEKGLQGLIDISELSWTERYPPPSEFFKEGEEINVVVLEIDQVKRSVSLSYKRTKSEDPWERASDNYSVGSVVQGRIVSITAFGALARLEADITGVIPISELKPRCSERVEDAFSVGDELDLKVVDLDVNARQITLNLKTV